jgi:hypothetical protein
MTDSPFPPDRRAAAKQRCDDASPGPWLATRPRLNWRVRLSDGTYILETGSCGVRTASDAKFIEAARTDLPDALAELDAKEAEVARLTARVAELEAELRRVAPHLAMRGVGGYRLEGSP